MSSPPSLLRNKAFLPIGMGQNAYMQNKKNIREVLARNLRDRMAANPAIGTQELLASRAGVDQSYLSKVLRLKTAPTIDALAQLAHGCRCLPWELLLDGVEAREEAIRRFLGPQDDP